MSRQRTALSLTVFLLVAFGLSWLVASPLWLLDQDALDPMVYPMLFGAAGTAMMLTPTIAALAAVKLVERRSWRDTARRLRLGMPGGFRRIAVWTLGSAGAFMVICFVVAGLGLATGAIMPDWSFAALEAQAEGAMPGWVLFAITLAAIPVAAFLPNGILGAGEEIGWRGYLTPVLIPLGKPAAVILSGAIWGAWHAPLVMLGYNFGMQGLPPVGLMIVGCIMLGWLFIELTERVGSVWPAAVGHGAFNAAAGTGLALQAADVEPDLVLVSPLGVLGWIVCGAAGLLWVLTTRLGSKHVGTP